MLNFNLVYIPYSYSIKHFSLISQCIIWLKDSRTETSQSTRAPRTVSNIIIKTGDYNLCDKLFGRYPATKMNRAITGIVSLLGGMTGNL